MTSKLVLDNLAGRTTAGSITIVGEGNSTTTNLQNGLCKAWVTGGNDAAITDSININDSTDHGNGTYSYNLINPMSAVNSYAQSGISRATTDGRIVTRDAGNDTAGVIAMEGTNESGTKTDMAHDMFIVGDLA